MDVENEAMRALGKRLAGEIVMSSKLPAELRRWRRFFNVSQAELARAMGVSPSVISDYESGRRESPRVDTIRRIVESLLSIDASRGGATTRSLVRMMIPQMPPGVVLAMREFSIPVKVGDIAKAVEGDLVVGSDLAEREIFGYTVIDSLRAIVELEREDFIRLYGLSSERALVFTGVAMGRSPFVAIKVGGINPGTVVLHGTSLTRVDELGRRIAERENIPLIISRCPRVERLIERLANLG